LTIASNAALVTFASERDEPLVGLRTQQHEAHTY
jgi:hypothetical protein